MTDKENRTGEPESDRRQRFRLVLISSIMTLLWIAMSLMRLLSPVRVDEKVLPPLDDSSQILDRTLYYNFNYSTSSTMAKSLIDGLNMEAERLYRSRLNGESDDVEDRIKLFIIDSLMVQRDRDKKRAEEQRREIYRFLRDNIRGRGPLIDILKTLYSHPEDMKIPEKTAVRYEGVINRELKGFYRDYTLYTLYEMSETPHKTTILMTGVNRITRMTSLGLALMVLLVVCALAGMVALLVFPVISLYYSRLSLENQGIRTSGGRFDTALLPLRAWLLFLFWEFVRFFFSIITTVYFQHRGDVPVVLAFAVYVAGYAFTLWMAFQVFSGFSLSWIGLGKCSFMRNARLVMMGFIGYCMTIPLIIIGANLFKLVSGRYPQSQNQAFNIMDSVKNNFDVFLLFLLICIIGPIFEEILFRGVLYTSLRRKLPAFVSTVLVSLLFAYIHFDPGVTVNLFILAMVINVLYERTSSLLPSIVTHILWNSMTFLVFFSLMK